MKRTILSVVLAFALLFGGTVVVAANNDQLVRVTNPNWVYALVGPDQSIWFEVQARQGETLTFDVETIGNFDAVGELWDRDCHDGCVICQSGDCGTASIAATGFRLTWTPRENQRLWLRVHGHNWEPGSFRIRVQGLRWGVFLPLVSR
jgi:hypothetical protein